MVEVRKTHRVAGEIQTTLTSRVVAKTHIQGTKVEIRQKHTYKVIKWMYLVIDQQPGLNYME